MFTLDTPSRPAEFTALSHPSSTRPCQIQSLFTNFQAHALLQLEIKCHNWFNTGNSKRDIAGSTINIYKHWSSIRTTASRRFKVLQRMARYTVLENVQKWSHFRKNTNYFADKFGFFYRKCPKLTKQWRGCGSQSVFGFLTFFHTAGYY